MEYGTTKKIEGVQMTYLDAGHWVISGRAAIKLGKAAGGARQLPRPGYEKCITLGGDKWWMSRTIDYSNKVVWAIRKTVMPVSIGDLK
jgi:hypothetical protein